ncbi:MAG: hypothetical protein IJ094_08745 [Bacilli bacterium]|nr:hypothetical protein [Bacilli bacterium]
MNKKFSPFVLISIIALVAVIVLSFIMRDIKLYVTVSLCLSLVSFVFAIIGLATAKRMNYKGKGIAVLFLILSIVGVLTSLLLNITFKMLNDPKVTEEAKLCDKASECVDKNGISTCYYNNVKQLEMKCKTSILNDDQMK